MELLRTNIVVRDDRKRNPQNRPVVGDVALLDSGRVVARYRVEFADGTAAYGVGDFALDVDPPTMRDGAIPKDWGRWMTEEIERGQGSYRQLGPKDFVSANEVEYAAFRGAYPHVAAFLQIPTAAPRAPLFDVGRVHIPRHWHDIDWRELLRKHDSGGFGVYGKYDDAPLTEDEIWTLPERPVITANKAAIAAKSGSIRSRYHLPASRIVTVVTVSSPGGARTLMTADHADADLAGHP